MKSTHRRPCPLLSASAATAVVVLLTTSWVIASPVTESGVSRMTVESGFSRMIVESGFSRTERSDQAASPAAREFEQRLVEYLNLRRGLSEKLVPLAPTASARELASRQAELATALRAARATAKPGDLVPASVAAQIQALIVEDLAQRSAADERATFSEVPHAARPTINMTYPANAALSTMPPLLLLRLPRLPENLQYRFYGRHLILLDGDTQIIVDYVPNVLPRH